jgi:hypothetical protein
VVARTADHTQSRDARLKRLAENIDALAQKDERLLRRTREIAELRQSAASDIYAICASFVNAINSLLAQPVMELDPPDFPPGAFQEDAPNLMQTNVRGRILQVSFAATAELISTEEFRVPYILSGTVRAFNQELLDKDIIEEQLIFYTLENHRKMWRFFDPRTYRSGPFDQEYLVSLMEQLL